MAATSLDTLRSGDPEEAWSLFMDEHRRLVFAVIRRYATDPDDVMDLFAHVCERLRANNLARLRKYTDYQSPRAKFSTWLVAVVRNLIVDWFRARDGRPRTNVPANLTPLGERIHECMFEQGYSQREAYEVIRDRYYPELTDREYQRAVRDVHRLVFAPSAGAWSRGTAAAIATEGDATEDHGATDSAELVQRALSALDPSLRLAVQLFVVDETPAADIARVLGWSSAKAVYNAVNRGLAAVRHALDRRGIHRGDL